VTQRSTLGSASGGRDCRRHKRYRWISSPHNAAAEAALAKDPHWIAPFLWRSEFRNIMALAIRRNTVTIDTALEIVRRAEASLEHNEFVVWSDAILKLVARSNCTAYDCEFVALAQAEGVQLVTADRQTLREFPEVAISLNKFVRD
jgi:predicted nucleic acid-binding protein